MIAYSLAVGAGLFVEAWILALVLIRGRRAWLQAGFAALVLTLIVNGAAFIGISEGFLPATWESAVLWTLVLAHPLTAILVLTLIHGETVPRRRPAVFTLLALVPVVVLFTPRADWAVQHAYEPNVLGAFLIVCLGIALAEAVYQRMTSALRAVDSAWLAFAVAALIIGGPVYALEFQDLGILQSAGSNVAAPVAIALFAVVLFHGEPFAWTRSRRASHPSGPGTLDAGAMLVLDEARPKYATHFAQLAATGDMPVLVVARAKALSETEGQRPDFAAITPSRHGASRLLGTVSEFWTRSPGGIAVLLDVGDVAMMSGWARTEEAILRMRSACRDTKSRLLLSASRLTPEERESLRAHQLQLSAMPDPGLEMEAVLGQSFASGARQLLEAYCRSRGSRREALSLDDVEPFLGFLNRAVAALGTSAADDAARAGLRAQAATAASALRAFAALPPTDLMRGDWPSQRASETDRGFVVTAADYWKGKEMDELFATASDLGERESVFERTRAVFVEQLGEAGEGVLRSELSKLGKKPEELRPEDVARLADRAAVDLVALADVVDVPQERARIQGQVDSIRRRLEAIAGEQP